MKISILGQKFKAFLEIFYPRIKFSDFSENFYPRTKNFRNFPENFCPM